MITPARDERQNLVRLHDSLARQTMLPARWLIVDNGSTDGTAAFAAGLADHHDWVKSTAAPGTPQAVPGAPIVRAFHAGVAALDTDVDVIVKVDADVSMGANYFEQLLAAFRADPALGLAGGACAELLDGQWRTVETTGSRVRGAVRAYRRDCLEQLVPLAERTGWDTLDELQAELRGWGVRAIGNLEFRHHRALGERDGGRSRRWRAQGSAAHFLGYRPDYLLFRTLYHCRREPAAVGLVVGYALAALRREQQQSDPQARRLLRRRQSLRRLGARALTRR